MANNLDLGQHFMIDVGIVERTVNLASLSSSDRVLEVGLGDAILTRQLAASGAHITVVEIDPRFTFKADNVDVIYGNILEEFQSLSFNKVVANIPYHVSEPLFIKLLDFLPEKIVIVVGKKFAKVLTSDSILGTIYRELYAIKVDQEIPPSAFNPPPSVDSALVVLTKSKDSAFANYFRYSNSKVKNYLLRLSEGKLDKRVVKSKMENLAFLEKELYTLSTSEFLLLHRFIKDHRLA